MLISSQKNSNVGVQRCENQRRAREDAMLHGAPVAKAISAAPPSAFDLRGGHDKAGRWRARKLCLVMCAGNAVVRARKLLFQESASWLSTHNLFYVCVSLHVLFMAM